MKSSGEKRMVKSSAAPTRESMRSVPNVVYHEKAAIFSALRRALQVLTPAEIRDQLEEAIRERND